MNSPQYYVLYLNNHCLHGDLPVDWTRANVAPIFKKGSKLQAVNYRLARAYLRGGVQGV